MATITEIVPKHSKAGLNFHVAVYFSPKMEENRLPHYGRTGVLDTD